MSKLLNFMFSESCYFLNCDYDELKRSSKKNCTVSERQRWAVVVVPDLEFKILHFSDTSMPIGRNVP